MTIQHTSENTNKDSVGQRAYNVALWRPVAPATAGYTAEKVIALIAAIREPDHIAYKKGFPRPVPEVRQRANSIVIEGCSGDEWHLLYNIGLHSPPEGAAELVQNMVLADAAWFMADAYVESRCKGFTFEHRYVLIAKALHDGVEHDYMDIPTVLSLIGEGGATLGYESELNQWVASKDFTQVYGETIYHALLRLYYKRLLKRLDVDHRILAMTTP